jgi:thiol:disulfide interchange protein
MYLKICLLFALVAFLSTIHADSCFSLKLQTALSRLIQNDQIQNDNSPVKQGESISRIIRVRGGAGGSVMKISSQKQFDDLLAAAKDNLVVVDFTASWCGKTPSCII